MLDTYKFIGANQGLDGWLRLGRNVIGKTKEKIFEKRHCIKAIFYLCPENLSEDELQSNGLICSVEELSGHSSFEHLYCGSFNMLGPGSGTIRRCGLLE